MQPPGTHINIRGENSIKTTLKDNYGCIPNHCLVLNADRNQGDGHGHDQTFARHLIRHRKSCWLQKQFWIIRVWITQFWITLQSIVVPTCIVNKKPIVANNTQ